MNGSAGAPGTLSPMVSYYGKYWKKVWVLMGEQVSQNLALAIGAVLAAVVGPTLVRLVLGLANRPTEPLKRLSEDLRGNVGVTAAVVTALLLLYLLWAMVRAPVLLDAEPKPSTDPNALEEVLRVALTTSTFQARELSYERVGTAIGFRCTNDGGESLRNCRAWLARLVEVQADGALAQPAHFSALYLTWDTAQQQVDLLPGEGRICELATHDKDNAIFAHISRFTTNLPWVLKDGRYVATVEWRADDLVPYSRDIEFEAVGNAEIAAQPGVLRFTQDS